jgi:hypothetical protein
MKFFFQLIIILVIFNSCKKDKSISGSCSHIKLPNINNTTFELIPINNQNFWIYTDSTWDKGTFISEKSTLLKIENIYDLGGITAIQFTSILPLLSIQGDTLYSTEITSTTYPNCYKLHYPMFFNTNDSIQVDTDPSNKYVYKSTSPIVTPVGVFSDNIVYNEANSFEIISHRNIGIIKISFFIDHQKRRTLTLKDYNLY